MKSLNILDNANIKYQLVEYDTLAEYELTEENIFKTLIGKNKKGDLYVFCIPINSELDPEKTRPFKNLKLLNNNETIEFTGCSLELLTPVTMGGDYKIFFDNSALIHNKIGIGAGIINYAIIASPIALTEAINAKYKDLIKNI